MTLAFLILETVVLGAFVCDLALDFSLLDAWSRTLLAVAAAGAGFLPLTRRAGPRRSAGQPLVILAAASLLLALFGFLDARRAAVLARDWDASSRTRLETRAATIEREFSEFLEALAATLRSGSETTRAALFDALAAARWSGPLPADRLGLAVYRTDGTLLAWDGNSAPVPDDLLARAGPETAFVPGGRDLSRLYAFAAAPDGTVRVAEFVLKSPALPPGGEVPRLDFLPGRAAGAQIRLNAGPGDDLALFFARHGDRFWSVAGSGPGGATLAFPLRGPSGVQLATVTLRDGRATERIGAWRTSLRQAGALLTAVSLLAAWSLAPAVPAGLACLMGALAVAAVRLVLLLATATTDPSRSAVFDGSIFGSPFVLGLARSPFDLAATTGTLLALAWLLRQWMARIQAPAAARRRAWAAGAAVLACVVLAVAGGAVIHRVVDRVVLDARLDIGRVGSPMLPAPRLLLQISLFFLCASFLVVLESLVALARRMRRESGAPDVALFGRLPHVLRAAVAVALLTLLYSPLLHHAYDRMRRALIEDEAVPRLVHQKERRRQALRDALDVVRGPEWAAGAGFADEEEETGQGAAAYRLWTATPMAARRLASSLQMFDEDGRRLSRFAVNVAPRLEVGFEAAARAAGRGLVEVPAPSAGTVRKPVVFGAEWVAAPRRPPLLAVLTVVDSYDNVPLPGAEPDSLDLFRAGGAVRSNPELLRTPPRVAVFGPRLERVYETGGEIPAPPPSLLEALDRRELVWTRDVLDDGEARVAYVRGGDVTFALAYPHPGYAGLLAAYLRLFLLDALFAAVLFGLARGGAWITSRRMPRLPPATYYGRLVTLFLLAGLVPLLTLAYFLARVGAEEYEKEVTASGLTTLQVVRRVAEDYLASADDEDPPGIDDDVLFWISRMVRQDVSVFGDGDLLATSTRELYGSGLLNARLDGAVYRAIHLDREPFRLARDQAGGVDHLALSAPMRIDRRGTMGVVSIPLAEQKRAAARKAEEVDDAVLIITCATILLLAAVGYVVARRVAEPVALLARAARRVAEGDLDVRVSPTAGDETAVLVESFNRMAASLRVEREALRRRTDYIEKILKSATTGVVSIDASGAIITINPAAQALLAEGGDSPEVGENLPDRLGGDPSLEPLRAALRRSLARRPKTARLREAELVLAKGGSERRLRAVFIPFAPEENAPPGRIVLLEDVTEIVRSGRLAAWAEMARRVAHEIKNPLTPIQLSVEHVRRVWEAGDARFGAVLEECLDNIQRQIKVLRQIAFEFSAYARLPRVETARVALEAVLDDALGPYTTAPPPGVTLRRHVASGLPAILADRTILGRALVNLIENALQAMKAGGTLTVSAEALGGDSVPPRVRIEVRDTGTGIEPEILPRIFEPYFSTKDGGTGLGLGVVKRAVEEHGGTIAVDSRPGEGTRVVIELPAVADAAPA